MKSIDIMGVFSDADLWRNNLPVLYKILATCLKAKDKYRLSKVFLLYGVSNKNESGHSPEEAFLEAYSTTIEELKKRYPDADFSSFGVPHFHEWDDDTLESLQLEGEGVHLCFKKVKKGESLSTYSYFKFFSICLASSKAEAMLFNLQSGNPQTKEALQLAELSYKGESFVYNESFKNKKSVHQTDARAIAYLKDKEGHPKIDEEKDSGPDYLSRVDAKAEDEELSRESHERLIVSLIEKGKYLEAARECSEHDFALPKEKREMLLSIFSDYRPLRFDENDRVSKGEVADYFFSRLAYLEALPESERGEKLACSVLNRLLYTLFHLECAPYVKRKGDAFLVNGDEHFSAKEYERYIDLYHNDRDSNENNGILFVGYEGKNYPELVDGVNLDRFISRYRYFRHPDLYREDQNKSDLYDPKALLRSLKDKFDRQYCSFLTLFKEASFSDCFLRLRQFLLKESKDEKVAGHLMAPELKEGEKVCILSMAGSTDPGNFPKGADGKFCYGSTLCFMKALETPEGCGEEAMEYLLPLKGKKLPFYFALTAETASSFFKENGLTYDELKEIYGGHDLYLIPFARNANGEPCHPKKRVERSSSLKEKDLLDLKSYGEEEKGYSYELCFSFVSELIHALLNRYDRIYLVESSGLPNCKVAFAFFSAFYPERIKTFTVKSPQDFHGFHDPKGQMDKLPIDFDAPLPSLTSSPTVLDLILNEERNSALLRSYLEQTIDFGDLGEETLKGLSNEERDRMKDHDEKDEKKELSKKERTARELVKIHFLIEGGKSSLALECMDFCLESTFKRVGKHYEKFGRAEGMAEARDMAHGDPSLNRFLNPLNSLWEAASDIKHGVTSFKLNEAHISMLLSFDSSLRDKYKKELDYYKGVKKSFGA